MTDKITQLDKDRLELLCVAAEESQLALMLCLDKETGKNEPVLVVCNETDENYEFYPIGLLFTDIDAVFDRFEPLMPMDGAE